MELDVFQSPSAGFSLRAAEHGRRDIDRVDHSTVSGSVQSERPRPAAHIDDRRRRTHVQTRDDVLGLPAIVPERAVMPIVEPGEDRAVVVDAAGFRLVVEPRRPACGLKVVRIVHAVLDVHLSDLYHLTYL